MQFELAAAAHHRLALDTSIPRRATGRRRALDVAPRVFAGDPWTTGGNLVGRPRGLGPETFKPTKDHLANCDLPRRNDLDGSRQSQPGGPGGLSPAFFLEICIDQISFMEQAGASPTGFAPPVSCFGPKKRSAWVIFCRNPAMSLEAVLLSRRTAARAMFARSGR